MSFYHIFYKTAGLDEGCFYDVHNYSKNCFSLTLTMKSFKSLSNSLLAIIFFTCKTLRIKSIFKIELLRMRKDFHNMVLV